MEIVHRDLAYPVYALPRRRSVTESHESPMTAQIGTVGAGPAYATTQDVRAGNLREVAGRAGCDMI